MGKELELSLTPVGKNLLVNLKKNKKLRKELFPFPSTKNIVICASFSVDKFAMLV